MTPKALIFGHADGDGYLATQQTCENLQLDGFDILEVVVDPKLTRNYRFWETTFQSWPLIGADLAVVVDITFNFRDPLRSYEALSYRAGREQATEFLVIDHHPEHRSWKPPGNVTVRMVDEVYQCCYGAPSELMVIAAICERDESPIQDLITEQHRALAKGVTRAAADHDGLAGAKLLQMIRQREWQALLDIANEPGKWHRSFYGRRWKSLPASPALQKHRYGTHPLEGPGYPASAPFAERNRSRTNRS